MTRAEFYQLDPLKKPPTTQSLCSGCEFYSGGDCGQVGCESRKILNKLKENK